MLTLTLLLLGGVAVTGQIPVGDSQSQLIAWSKCPLYSLESETHFKGVTTSVSGWYPPHILAAQPSLSRVFRDSSDYDKAKGVTKGKRLYELLFAASASSSSPSTSPTHVVEAECTMVTVPLRHEIPASTRTTQLFVKRLLKESSETSVQSVVWLLQGGPGASSVALEETMEQLWTLIAFKNVAVYTADHRFVARSQRIECVATGAELSGSRGGTSIVIEEVQRCTKEVERNLHVREDSDNDAFRALSVTEAALDLASLVTMTRQLHHNAEVIVYGVSYGTAWVSRYAQVVNEAITSQRPPTDLVPDWTLARADKIVLDSTMVTGGDFYPAGRSAFNQFDVHFEKQGERLCRQCAADPECSQHFGPFPCQVVRRIADTLSESKDIDDVKHCQDLAKAGLTRKVLRVALSTLIESPFRAYIMPLLHRVRRCSKIDVTAVIQLFDVVFGANDTSGDRDRAADIWSTTPVLYNTIVASEFWNDVNTSVDALENFERTALFAPGLVSLEQMLSLEAKHPWPRYKRDHFFEGFPVSSADLLVLSGELDAQTPTMAAEKHFAGFTASSKSFVRFQNGNHYVLGNSAVTPITEHLCLCDKVQLPEEDAALLQLLGASGDAALVRKLLLLRRNSACGLQVLISFIEGTAQTDKLNLHECTQRLREVPVGGLGRLYNRIIFNDDSAFGTASSVSNENPGFSQKSRSSLKVPALITLSAVSACVALCSALLLWRKRNQRSTAFIDLESSDNAHLPRGSRSQEDEPRDNDQELIFSHENDGSISDDSAELTLTDSNDRGLLLRGA